MSSFWPSRLSLKIIITVLIPIILMGGAFVFLFAYNSLSWQNHNEINHQIQLLNLLKTNLMDSFIRQDVEAIHHQLSLFSKLDGIDRIRLLTSGGKILYDSQGKGTENKIDPSDQDCLTCHQSKQVEVPHSVRTVLGNNNKNSLRHFTPLTNQEPCLGCHPNQHKILGFFLADFSQAKFNDKQRLFLWTQVGLSSLVTILVMSIILYITLRIMVDYPLRQIISRIRGISVISGKLNQIEFRSADEIGEIVGLINDLAERLRYSREELASLYQANHEISSTLDFENNILASSYVQDLMDKGGEVIYEDMSVREIMNFIKASQNTFFPVIDSKHKYLGVITLHEIRNLLIDQDLSNALYARDFYRSDAPFISPLATLEEAARLLLNNGYTSLPVVEEKTRLLMGLLKHDHIFKILKTELLKRVGL